MAKKRREKKPYKMKFTTKLLLVIIAVAALIVLSYQGYLTLRYRLHNGHLAILEEYKHSSEKGFAFHVPDGAPPADIPDYTLAAESNELRLYVDESTGNAAIYDKRSSSIIYSVHPDMPGDPVASDLNKSLLQSQLTLSYFTPMRIPGNFNSYDHAVSLGQFRIESISDGFRVIYTIGDISSPTGIVPVYITPERLLSILAPLEGTRAYNRNLMRYVESTVAPGHMELIAAARTGTATLREMNEVFESLGYTAEDFASDMAGSGIEEAVPLHFTVPVEFRLDRDSLIVNVNADDIREYAGGRIDEIQLMRGFGAGSINEEGYLVVPNGSGSLIYFNNKKTYADEYMQFIYGQDPMLREYATLGNTEDARFPFFGIEAGSRTILAMIESGESQAYLTAGISEMFNSYNYIYPGFILRGSLSLAMFGMTGNEATLPVVERDMPKIDLTIRYMILENSGYSGMAARARELLIENGSLNAELLPQNDIPFYMDLVGSVMGQKFLAGIRYMGQIPMTTFSGAGEIVDYFNKNDVTRQVINYQGWFNRGYYHDVSDKIRPVRQLGNVRELEQLARHVEGKDGKLYSDTTMLTVPWSSRRYRWDLESTRYYGGGMVGGFGLVNPVTLFNTFSLGYLEVMYNALSPRFLTRYMDDYIKAFSKYDVTGTSLRDMGDFLASDRRRTGVIHREDAKDIIMYNMEKLQNQGQPLMITGGNIYALRFADDIINMSLNHNSFYIVDEEIPFYQMILHGRINYAGFPINLSSNFNMDEIILRLVEYGASPHFAFTHVSANEMKYTGANWMYSTDYHNWRSTAADIYHEVNGALSIVSGAEIASHEILPDGLRIITYSNGVKIIINRSRQALVYDGITIPATGFTVKEAAS
ncbi:MAG: DUF5696 domain-containing protein [Oscillospiraceae bacterium]|nr:DUF5696 domain-containing protein [Oscillospiraceae bacterium]